MLNADKLEAKGYQLTSFHLGLAFNVAKYECIAMPAPDGSGEPHMSAPRNELIALAKRSQATNWGPLSPSRPPPW